MASIENMMENMKQTNKQTNKQTKHEYINTSIAKYLRYTFFNKQLDFSQSSTHVAYNVNISDLKVA